MIVAIAGPPLLAGGHFFFKTYGGPLKEQWGWMLDQSGATVAFAGAIVLAVLLIRVLGRSPPDPPDSSASDPKLPKE